MGNIKILILLKNEISHQTYYVDPRTIINTKNLDIQ